MTKFLCALSVFCGLVSPALALDREAFTFTNYNLDVRVEPEQQRLGVRGRITLRNDSAVAQKNLVLQVSSTLAWRSIQVAGKPVQFETHDYTSDIDHTGALSEAIVSLPHEVPPKGTVELDIGYEGVIPLDATRLTRIGVPDEKAKHNDWDHISQTFTAVRGIGYVAWYPVATEAASLADGDAVGKAVGRWIVRHADSSMDLQFKPTSEQTIYFSGTPNLGEPAVDASIKTIGDFSLVRPGVNVPTFVLANYQKLPPLKFLDVEFLPGQEEAAKDYAEVAAQINPPVAVGPGSRDLQILSLPDANASSFVTQGMLLMPLGAELTNQAELDIVYAIARQAVHSPRAWIQEGLAHYAQPAFVEQNKGLQAALDYLDGHRTVLADAEKPTIGKAGERETAQALINAPDDLYLQAKSMYVWWMLKDMLGNLPSDALLRYHADQDKDPTYMPRLIASTTKRDLQWFFDDWVYHDRGLPDFRVASVFSRPLDSGRFLVTITVENLGRAGAEVPVTLRIEGGEVRQRIEVRGQAKASIRIEASSTPLEVVINDGSVPESDVANNTYKIESVNP
ncbi:MAG: hypothetical protein ACRD3L_13840 [Terriglobales bacterium]